MGKEARCGVDAIARKQTTAHPQVLQQLAAMGADLACATRVSVIVCKGGWGRLGNH